MQSLSLMQGLLHLSDVMPRAPIFGNNLHVEQVHIMQPSWDCSRHEGIIIMKGNLLSIFSKQVVVRFVNVVYICMVSTTTLQLAGHNDVGKCFLVAVFFK